MGRPDAAISILTDYIDSCKIQNNEEGEGAGYSVLSAAYIAMKDTDNAVMFLERVSSATPPSCPPPLLLYSRGTPCKYRLFVYYIVANLLQGYSSPVPAALLSTNIRPDEQHEDLNTLINQSIEKINQSR
jgi:hypothetical protein